MEKRNLFALVIAFLFAFTVANSAQKLECYSCVHKSSAPNRLCVTLTPERKRLNTDEAPEGAIKAIEGGASTNNEPAKVTACATFCGTYNSEETFLRYRTENANATNIGKCRDHNIRYDDASHIHGVSCYCNNASYCNRHNESMLVGYDGYQRVECELRKGYEYYRTDSSSRGKFDAELLAALAMTHVFVKI